MNSTDLKFCSVQTDQESGQIKSAWFVSSLTLLPGRDRTRRNTLHLYNAPSSTAPKVLSMTFSASVKPVTPVIFIPS